MSRILGFVVGAVLVFGGLLYLLTPTGAGPATAGLERPVPPPVSAAAETAPEQTSPTNEAAERLPVGQETSPPEPTERLPVRQETSQPEPASEPEARPGQIRLAQAPAPAAAAAAEPALPGMDMTDEQALVEQALAVMQETMPPPVSQREPGGSLPGGPPGEFAPESAAVDDNTQWFAVWDPFHSELSAKAFARRLERLTGLDYRVVRSGRAKYEVAVAFVSEPERVANIALIEEATGLRIAGGDL